VTGQRSSFDDDLTGRHNLANPARTNACVRRRWRSSKNRASRRRPAGLPDHLIYKQPLDGVADREVSQTLTESEEVLTSRLWTRAV
jgi:hypothetical protein